MKTIKKGEGKKVVSKKKDPKDEAHERHAHRKTVYKETEELISEKEDDSGETSSVVDMGRTDFIIRPKRKNRPLGSSHEPGTMPGRDI
ncbi:MAG: hypothetical protein P0Y49_05490 [Candidatus Pedobacter colombiensis]|uniref:Uncharacterized protein n=1 Tax=Candidatus Pedobacter colombiensis TaxID=3121371 RepID=A0AAJ5WBK1_9SPHI|nr:hypothetical protein [Pedobacter sp.]WEK20590.1 MAG: hypothetical protein P0Y49_05490 [Pedobacter sp.]